MGANRLGRQYPQVRDVFLYAEDQSTEEGGTVCRDLWFTPKNGTCLCGSRVHGAVSCNEQTGTVMILDCYCMTRESVTKQMVVGDCFYNCVNMTKNAQYEDYFYHQVPSDCAYLHRTGTLCGCCDYSNSYFPRAYSYDMKCMECDLPHSWWLYITAAFLPLTVFIVVILVFRISVVSPKLHAFVYFSQTIASPIQLRIVLVSIGYMAPVARMSSKLVATAYGIWNLDFFRVLLPGMCLHLTTLQVLALDYLIAVYPMLLMVVAYILAELHHCGFKPLIWLWKPFHYFFARFRREWDIQTSLIDAFVTFFILSITKLLCVSFDLLIPTTLYIASGDTLGVYLYYDANIEYMRREHIYYALLALIVLGLFLFLPLSLIIFSTFSCGRDRIRIRVVRDFLHTLQRYYKDGSNGTRDCRWFAGYYMLHLFGTYVLYACTRNGYLYEIVSVYCIIAAIIVLVVEPYREEYAMYNTLNCLLFLWLALFALAISLLNMVSTLLREYMVVAYVVAIGVSAVPLLLISVVATHWLLRRTRCLKRRRSTAELDASLAHRITNSKEYKDNCGYIALHRSIEN